MRKTLEQRFWEKVDIKGPDDCWPWMAGKSKKGYGKFRIRGKHVRAHRLAYELVKGPIPADLDACHSCDNPPCCNPTHVWPGTRLDNMQDAASKVRTARGVRHGWQTHPESRPRGERNGSARLNAVKVGEVRRLSAEGSSEREIGQLMGVNHTTVGRVVRGETWKHIGL